MRLSMVLSLLRPVGPVVVGISLGFTLSLLSVTWVEEPCGSGPRLPGGQEELADSGHDVGAVRKPNSVPAGMDNSENFEPKIIPYTPPDPKKVQKKPVRSRYISTELGIREQLFVGVLTSKTTLNTLAVAVNRTLGHRLERLVYFTGMRGRKLPHGMTVVTHGDDRPIWNMYQTVKHLLDHYIQEYDWFYLVQDDTYTEAYRISKLAAHLSIDADLYLGRPEEFIGGDTEGRYCYGGFGYLLSRGLLKKLQPHLESCRNDILSARPDEWLGRCIIDYTHVNCVEEHEPESEVFEITDFTTASDWERFISKVEEVLNDWKLIGVSSKKTPEKGQYTNGVWEEKGEDVLFADFKFSLKHHYLVQDSSEREEKDDEVEDSLAVAMQDLLCTNNDFPPIAHCLVRWYGLREFVVISPAANDAVISESKCNLLLSSVSIALGNTGCQVPVFVHIHQKWRKLYVGECQGPGVRTDFEMVHLRKVPNQYTHLSGLLDIFKSKIGCPLTTLPPINIAIRFTYVLQDWQQYFWPQQPPDIDAVVGGEVGGLEFGKLPFGACEDPISELHLATTWPCLTEGIIVDNDVYSDLDPLQAPQWSVRVRKADNPQCMLGDFVSEFFRLCRRKESTDELLGKSAFEENGKDAADISQALSKLTEPAAVPIHKLSVTGMVSSARKKIRKHRGADETPLSGDVLNAILFFLFPDAKSLDGGESRTSGSNANIAVQLESEDYNLYSQLKSAPSGSLTFKLALCLCMVNLYHGGVRGVAHLWQEFVLEMRYRWENNYLVPGLSNGPPDLKCCLLHQKLQMLNCCIERKKARDDSKKGNTPDSFDSPLNRPANDSTNSSAELEKNKYEVGKSWDSWSDSEDEFFECHSDTEELKESGQEVAKKSTKEEVKEMLKPDGRLHQSGNLTLLHTGEPLYIPITQEPAPMTEDLLEEQSEVLAKLGTSAEGAHLRARMQSACLLSDMESFKAANPGCCLEDFVRWYSPRDYVEEEVVDESGNKVIKGELSARMKIPNNMWVEAWETARPTPARRQRRLFDDTREAEKVLHYLAVQKPADLTRHLLPCVIHAALLKVKEEETVDDIPSVKSSIKRIISHSSKVLRFPIPEDKKLEDIINQIINVEATIARARSLKAKFGTDRCENAEEKEDLEKFVSCLLEQPEVPIIGACRGPAGSIIHKMFVSAQRVTTMAPLEEEPKRSSTSDEKRLLAGTDFPSPAGREVILRTTVPRPAPYSKALPQRMYSVLTKDDFRLAGAFSSDTSFF